VAVHPRCNVAGRTQGGTGPQAPAPCRCAVTPMHHLKQSPINYSGVIGDCANFNAPHR